MRANRRNATRTRRPAPRRGVAAAEFAIVLPALLLIALGCIDFGRVMYHAVAVQNAARAGAEYAATTPYSGSDQAGWEYKVQYFARAELDGQTGCDPNRLTTSTTTTIEPDGLRRVRVTATYSAFETLVSWPGVPDRVTIRATVTMRVIR